MKLVCGSNAPCKDCPKRKVGCHDKCKDYKQFLVENEARKKRIKELEVVDSYGWRG